MNWVAVLMIQILIKLILKIVIWQRIRTTIKKKWKNNVYANEKKLLDTQIYSDQTIFKKWCTLKYPPFWVLIYDVKFLISKKRSQKTIDIKFQNDRMMFWKKRCTLMPPEFLKLDSKILINDQKKTLDTELHNDRKIFWKNDAL